MNNHNAPPVVYPLGRSALQGWILGGVWCSGLLLAGIWFYLGQAQAWAAWFMAAGILAAGLAARSSWKTAPVGQLSWDGQLWRWQSPGYQAGVAEQIVTVVADFQHVLVLRIENQAGASLWLWAERKAFSARWMDLRRAVYSTPRASLQAHWQDSGARQTAPHVAVSEPMQAADTVPAKP